ncbi:Imm1 family immunity protein [Actinopolyspora alba]|uniref:Imm1 family immunity protein n=1 Tax=Actinopolyspora alba TaxID=673379 RepID=UPI000A4508FA
MYITHNSDVESRADLLTDGGTPSYCPRSAALPLGDIRKALVEFVSTGKRPAGVDRKWFDRL